MLSTPFAWDEHEIPNDYGRYTSFGLKYLLEKNGFEIIKFKKTGHFTEVIFQFFIHYLRNIFYTQNKYINIFINVVLISPFTIVGLIFSLLLPRKQSLYFNNVVLAKKSV